MAIYNFQPAVAVMAATGVLLLAIALLGQPTSARVLDEVPPAVAPAAPVDTPAEPSPVKTPPAADVVETPPPTPAPVDTPPAATAPAPAAAPPTTAGATPAAGCPAADHTLTFVMHYIVGGSHPSASMATASVENAAVNVQLPFAKPNGAVLPGDGGVPLNKANNGIINNNIPFLSGLGGATTAVVQSNGNNAVDVNSSGGTGSLPVGPTLQKLLFGTMTVIDDELTEGQEKGSGVVGKAQGFYIGSSDDGTSQTMAFTAMFKEGGYADSISFFGVHRTADSESHVAVVGGTGKYVNAKGFATLRMLPPADHIDGVETLLQIDVTLVY